MTFSRLVLSLSDKNGERRVLELLKLDTGIIVMPEYPDLDINNSADEYEEIAERIFIPIDNLKNYLNESHYLFNFFNGK